MVPGTMQGLTQAGVRESFRLPNTIDYLQNETQLYFVRFSVFVESK